MTIAKRLIILVAVPLLVLAGLGMLIRIQLATIEARSRFVAELHIPRVAADANIFRSIAEPRLAAGEDLST